MRSQNEVSISLCDGEEGVSSTQRSIDYEKSNSSELHIEYFSANVMDYFPYGKILRSYTTPVNGNERFKSTHHERDNSTGLDYRGARFYDSEVGRFLTTDPLAADFASWSTYNYVLGNPVFFVDPTGQSPELPEGWSADNIRLANQFGLFANGGETFDGFFKAKSYDLGENGIVAITQKPSLLFFGKKARFSKPTMIPIGIKYYPGSNKDPFNFVQTVHTNFDNEQAVQHDKGNRSDIILGDYWSADGFNEYGTYYTPEELSFMKGNDNNGMFYEFNDMAGRTFVKGEKVFWSAELSIVKHSQNKNTNLITFTYGMDLKGNRPKLHKIKKAETISSYHKLNVSDAKIK